MPELPEMETYKRLLNQTISGKQITKVFVNREKSINITSENFIKKVKEKKIERIERNAKYLFFHLNDGYILLLHLMLGGWMFYGTEEAKPNRTVQIQLSFGNESLYFIGLRLGYLHLLSQEEVKQKVSELGPKPLDVNFSLHAFLKLTNNRRGKIKTTLVNQEFISGIGNRYSDEIAWHAKLLPERSMGELTDHEKTQLYQSIRFILQHAIRYGGYMEQPLFIGDAKTGGYNQHTYVYNREGKACKRCGEAIVKKEISSRKTFFCKGCQT